MSSPICENIACEKKNTSGLGQVYKPRLVPEIEIGLKHVAEPMPLKVELQLRFGAKGKNFAFQVHLNPKLRKNRNTSGLGQDWGPGSCPSLRSGSNTWLSSSPLKVGLRLGFGPHGLKIAQKLPTIQSSSSMLWNKNTLRLGIGFKLESCLGLIKKL